jgi:hypothetical protein
MDLREIGLSVRDWTDVIQNRDQGPVEGSFEHGNEISGFIKRWEILE